jgi:hypothetical protein
MEKKLCFAIQKQRIFFTLFSAGPCALHLEDDL